MSNDNAPNPLPTPDAAGRLDPAHDRIVAGADADPIIKAEALSDALMSPPHVELRHAHGAISDPFGRLTGHNYDGIEEYDNPTPSWWTWIFLLTIGYSALYMFVALLSGGGLSAEFFYERDYTESLKRQYGTLGDLKPDDATLLRIMGDPQWVKVGQSLYQTNCSACHGSDGSGGAGPNLTDESFLHIRKLSDIADVIANGRANGAMPAWGNRMLPVEQVLISSYVASLRGKNLPSAAGRPAEGQAIPPWPEPAK